MNNIQMFPQKTINAFVDAIFKLEFCPYHLSDTGRLVNARMSRCDADEVSHVLIASGVSSDHETRRRLFNAFINDAKTYIKARSMIKQRLQDERKEKKAAALSGRNIDTIKALVAQVECGDFEFVVRLDNERPYVQIQCDDKCTRSGEGYRWHGRKWFLSYHMSDSEIVQTCWAAAEMAMIHELRETFKWDGECIFRPHFDIRALHEISKANKVEHR